MNDVTGREVFEVLDAGFGLAIQDQGRTGWRRFGVPGSGVMDRHAAAWANRLLENPADAPVLEITLQGTRLMALEDTWIALTGAPATANVPVWQTVPLAAGERVEIKQCRAGVWSYLAVPGGFDAPKILGSRSDYTRAGLGRVIRAGDRLRRTGSHEFRLPPGVASRRAPLREQRDLAQPPRLKVWPGPQFALLSEADRVSFFGQTWIVGAQSNRVGYRLAGEALALGERPIVSEAVRPGSIQVPANGQPIVTMRDGPTVGGYPKLGVIDPNDLDWLAQCRPGLGITFQLASET